MDRREDVVRRVAAVVLPALLFAAVLAFAGCAEKASAGQDFEPWEVASWDALVLDEVVVMASRSGDIGTVIVRAEQPEMAVEEVVVMAEQPEGLPAPAAVSEGEATSSWTSPSVN